MSLIDLVHLTARFSALLFAAALALPAVWPRMKPHVADLFLGFVVAHTVHFAVVASYGLAVPGAALLPEGRTLESGGGWPAVFAIFAVFYVPALIGLAARRAGVHASRRLRRADLGATLFIGFMFLATYVPLMQRSALYAVPAVVVAATVLVWLASGRRRPLGKRGQVGGRH